MGTTFQAASDQREGVKRAMEQTRQHQHAGQSTAEYAIVLGVVITALVAMQVYVKRGINAKVKDVTDHLTTQVGSGTDPLTGAQLSQYEPYYTNSDYTVDQSTNSKDTLSAGGTVKRELTGTGEKTTRTGSSTQDVGLTADDVWQ